MCTLQHQNRRFWLCAVKQINDFDRNGRVLQVAGWRTQCVATLPDSGGLSTSRCSEKFQTPRRRRLRWGMHYYAAGGAHHALMLCVSCGVTTVRVISSCEAATPAMALARHAGHVDTCWSERTRCAPTRGHLPAPGSHGRPRNPRRGSRPPQPASRSR